MTTFDVEQLRERLRCSNCCSDEVWALRGLERSFRAYYLKEDLRQIRQQRSKLQAHFLLEDWPARFRVSGVSLLNQFNLLRY